MKTRDKSFAFFLTPFWVGAVLSIASLLGGCGKKADAYKCGLDLPTGYVSTSGSSTFSGLTSARQVGSTSVLLNWTHATGAIMYMIVDASGSKPKNIGMVPAPLNEYTVTGLTNGATYAFKVQMIQSKCEVLDPVAAQSIRLAAWTNTKSLLTDAATSYASTSTLQTILGTTSVSKFSLSFWHKTVAAVPAQYSGILGSTSTAAWDDGFGMYWETAGVARFFINSYSGHYVEYTVPLPDSWNHYVITYDTSLANQNLKLYVNGAVRSQHNYTTAITVPSATTLDFGRLQANSTRINGNFDEVAIWSSVLSAAEITQLYNSGHAIDPTVASGSYVSTSNLKSYWQMGDRASFPTIYNDAATSPFSAPSATIRNGLATDIVTDVP